MSIDKEYGTPCLPVELLPGDPPGQFWRDRDPMLETIQDWWDGHLSSDAALKRLEMLGLLDRHDLMFGLAAVVAARAKS